jgi:hypothetical protein
MAFDVVGDLEGEDLSGTEMEGDVEGYDVMGGGDIVGVVRRDRRTGRMKISPKPRTMQLAPKPGWRKEQMAPGVIRPDEGMVPLALTPNIANGVFAGSGGAIPNIGQITYSGQLQKPFRAERLLVSTARSVSATARLMGVLFVGTDLQGAEIGGWDIEVYGNPASFGTRLTCQPAEPGVLIRLVVTATPTLAAADTIFCTCSFSGRIIH